MIKKIKHLIRFINQFIYPFEAKPIIKFKETNTEVTNLLVNSSHRKRKLIYYIIKRPGVELFSNFIYVLNHLKITNSCGYEPLIDMENFKTIYKKKNKIKNTKNAWNYFFDNKKKINLNKIYKENNFIISTNGFAKTFSNQIDNDEFRYLFNKYFKIKNEFINYSNDFSKKNFKGKVLAIHLCDTSYKTSVNHLFPTTIERSINLISKIFKKYSYNKIFLCAENLSYFDAIIKMFKEKVIFLKNANKAYEYDAFNVYPRSSHRYKLNKYILIEALLISKCNGFIYTNTNLSEFVRFLDKKNKINYFSI